MQKEDDYLDLTIAIWGEDGVGKRSLLERFLTTSRREQKDGITIYPCRSQYNGVLIDFTFVVISSTANIESPGVTEIINKAVASICCYSYIDYGSQSSLDHWLQLARKIRPTAPVMLLCTKADAVDKSIISSVNHPPFKLSMDTNCLWNYCSSHLNEGVIDVMETTITMGLARRVGEVVQNNEVLSKPPLQESQIEIHGLFALIRCATCTNGMNVDEFVNHCFASECIRHQEYICDTCAASHPHPLYREKLDRVRAIDLQGPSVRNSLQRVFTYFAARPAFGWSTRNLRGSPNGENFVLTHQNAFQWITYQEFQKRALFVGRAFLQNIQQGQFVGVCGRNRLEWFLADFGLIFHNIRSIPVHTTYDVISLSHVIDNAQLVAIVCEKAQIAITLQAKILLGSSSLKYIICMDHLSESELADYHFNNSDVSFMNLYELEQFGKTLPPASISEVSSPDDIFVVEYTSGSTGKPKGVVLTEKAFNHKLIPIRAFKDIDLTPSYEPLAHSSHANNITHLCSGSPVILFEEQFSELFFQDMQLINPMSISGVPRIYNSIYTQHKVYKDQLKNQALHEGTLTPEKKAQIKGLCKEKFSKIFGNRLNIIVTGGAPTSPQVLKFLSSTFQNTYLFNGYGTTEAGGISFNGRHYGGVQIKLVDLPEYGFTSQDLPYPRGEVVVKTTKQGSGYYKETELTKNTWTEDGFIRTGDIGVMDKAGHIRVITRIKNVCKLAQGEYVDPDKLESVYLKSKFVDQIYVDINPVKEFLVAVVVPVQQILLEHFSGEDLDQVLTSSAANEMILKDLRDLANSEQLLGYEFIQGIIIRKEPFTAENGLATASHKVCRHKIAQEYHSELEKLYSTVETSQYRTLSDQIESLFQEVINKSDSSNPDASSSQNFLSQGGDSLSALNLLKLIKDKFNVELTIEDIATDQSTPQNIAKKLTQKVASPTQPIQRSSQSENTALKQEMISDSILEPNLIPVSGDLSPVQQIFLTGATGFIGMYLLYYLLKEYSTATIVCLIRGQDKSAFLEKLRAVQIEISVEDQNRIITVNGDLAKAYLGLSEENFNELSETVDTIFHCGAYVNHFLPYSALKSANVHGTKEMIRLACFGKPKQVHYISTISVISRVSEDSPLNIAEVPLGGYSCSKWVAEQLIHQAIERGLRGAVYRPSQISGHSQTGHAIIEHYINRLLLSFAFLKAIPGNNATIELTPVDFCASAIVKLANDQENFGKVFHISEPESVLSLSAVVPVLESFGITVEAWSMFDWVKRLTKAEKYTSEQNAKILAPLQLYFDRSMELFPSTSRVVTTNTEAGLRNKMPKSIKSSEKLQNYYKFLLQ